MPDFISQLNPTDPLTGLHAGLIALFDALLSDERLTDQEKKDMLARIRAQIDITLKPLG